MSKLIVHGGNKISGKLRLESAKNAVLPMIAGAILTKEQVVIKNCPKISDVLNMIKILDQLGVSAEFDEDDLVINSKGICSYTVPESLSKELRSSIYFMGALVSRVKKARISYPGGCDIGVRPIDLHVKGLRELGVSVTEIFGEIICTADRIKGKEIYLDFPSVGATENLMLIAVLADGKTEIHNAAREPEIIDFMRFLNSMGAKVYGAGTSTILIEGVKKLHGTVYLPMEDRIECGTYLLTAAITGGEIEISNCNAKNISPLIHKLCDNTCKININNDIIYLKSGKVKKAFSFSTGPHPFFPTDMQPQAMALCCVSSGVSVVTEKVFERRFAHVNDFVKMGADITLKSNVAIVNGVKRLTGASVTANDLRGGVALVLAGLVADGKTVVNNFQLVERGYYNLESKLCSLGANVKKKG